MRRGLFILSIVLGLLGAVGAEARTWYVTPDMTGDAPTVRAAIDSASAGDTVLVAPGTYTWTSQGPATWFSMILMKADVTLRGEAGAESTILDAERQAAVVNAFNVGSACLEGLTLMNGRAQGFPSFGGGIATNGLILVDCIIRDNRANDEGGGIWCSNTTITNCQILDNGAGVISGGIGGGIFSSGNSVISGCTFRGNGVGGDGTAYGGAVKGGAVISDCWFQGNLAGGAHGSLGGAVYGAGSIRRCTFVNNIARGLSGRSYGGAVASGGEISDCIFVGNMAVGKGQPGVGGAISEATSVTRCTLVRNSATGGPGAVGGLSLTSGGGVVSTIIAWSEGLSCGGNAVFSCCNVYGNSLGDSLCGTDGGGNFSLDPALCATDPANSLNLTLQQDSPCAPGNHPVGLDCGLIGAVPVGCGTVSVESSSWSDVKSLNRR